MSSLAVEPNGQRVWLIYGRKSKDGKAGDIPLPGQVTRCRTLGESLGGAIHEPPLTDVDFTAHHRSRRYRGRPAYDRLTGLLRDWPADGPRPGILAMHTDRLHRTVRELEDLIDLLDGRDVPVHTVQAGPLDLSTSQGRLVARIACAVAAHEIERMTERILTNRDDLAAAGKPKGGPRPYGYEKDGMTVRLAEAAEVGRWATMLLGGATLQTVVADIVARDIPTATGQGRWMPRQITRILTAPRTGGLREHRGQVVGPAVWEPLLDRETWEAVRALLTDPARSSVLQHRGAPHRYLCTGFAWCERCEHKLVSRPTNRVPTMVCSSLDWHGGCGGVAINAAKLEQFVSGWVLERLSDRRFLEGLAARERPDTAGLVADIEADERRLLVLGGGLTVGDPDIIPEQLAAIRTVRAHIAARRQDIARAATGGLLEQVDPETIAEQWWTWREDNLPLCRALLGLLVERIWVRSIGRGVRTVDARRVSIVPRP